MADWTLLELIVSLFPGLALNLVQLSGSAAIVREYKLHSTRQSAEVNAFPGVALLQVCASRGHARGLGCSRG